MRFPFERREIINLAEMLLFSFLIRVALFAVPGYKNDMGTFEAWFGAAANYGLRPFYQVVSWHSGYPPFNVYLFWLFGSLAKSLSFYGTPYVAYLIKLPSTLFDLAIAFLIFVFVRRKLDFRLSFIASELYAFNPATIFNSAVFGQYDAIYTFFLILSLMLILDSKPTLSAVAFTFAVLTKPQSIALAPLIVFLIVKKHGWKKLATYIIATAATVMVVILPFQWSNPVTFLIDIYTVGYGAYPFTTINAFNTWALFGMWQPDTQALFLIGWIMFGALTVFTLYVLHKRLGVSGEMLILFSAFILFFGFFMLPTRIHERYLFPALSALALMFPFVKKVKPIYGALIFTYLVNQAYVLYILNNDMFIQSGDPVVLVVSLINLIVFLYALRLMLKTLRGQDLGQAQPSQSPDKSLLEGSNGDADH